MYDVRSAKAVYDRTADGTAVATFTNPIVVFHDRRNRTMFATAPEAVAHDKDKTVVMNGGVHAKTTDGETLTCDSLSYDARHEQIRGIGHVVLVNAKTHDTVSGTSLTSDLSFEHVVLSSSP